MRNYGELIGLRLCDEQSVERIVMVAREGSRFRRVGNGYIQGAEIVNSKSVGEIIRCIELS